MGIAILCLHWIFGGDESKGAYYFNKIFLSRYQIISVIIMSQMMKSQKKYLTLKDKIHYYKINKGGFMSFLGWLFSIPSRHYRDMRRYERGGVGARIFAIILEFLQSSFQCFLLVLRSGLNIGFCHHL